MDATTTRLDPDTWAAVRRTVAAANRSGQYCTIASTDPTGLPHATPIGSFTPLSEPGRAVYLDVFNARLSRNVDRQPHVSILAVDSRKLTWLRGAFTGRFPVSPGLQLTATVGSRREATDDELERFRSIVGVLRHTRGGRALWGNVRWIRDVTIDSASPIRLGTTTHPRR